MPYYAGNEITVTWVLPPTDTPLTAADYDVRVMPSTLDAEYIDSGIINFVAPAEGYAGSLQYVFTPATFGHYMVILSVGTGAAHTVISERNFWVFGKSTVTDPSTEVLGNHKHPSPLLLPITGSWAPIDEIYDMSSDGENILFVGKDQGVLTYGVWKTDHSLSTPVKVAIYQTPDFSGAAGFRYLEWIRYSPSLDLWVCSTEEGDLYWSEDTGSTWTQCTTPGGWSKTNSHFTALHWNEYLGYWHASASNSTMMLVSTDGKTWTDQATDQVLGGTHPNRLHEAGTIIIGTTPVHYLAQWEEYCWKDVNTGGTTGWTKTTNNGVIGGANTWPIRHWRTDGSITIVAGFTDVATNTDPRVHANWDEFDITAQGVGIGDIEGIIYANEFANPWIMAKADATTWYDLDKIEATIAPQWNVSTNNYFASKNRTKNTKYNIQLGRCYQDIGAGAWAVIVDNFGNGGNPDEIILGAKR